MIPSLQIHTNEKGNRTLLRTDLNETYHSKHGAIAESNHVFIREGLEHQLKNIGSATLDILEIGFGTGLNAMLTLLTGKKFNLHLRYETLEPFPLPVDLIYQLQYQESWSLEQDLGFRKMHDCNWNEKIFIDPDFTFIKYDTRLEEFNTSQLFDLIYFDAFAPEKQSELWTDAVFKKLFSFLRPGAILVTYSAKGEVRRTLNRCGFEVERIPGPPFKRHMLRATKPNEKS